MHIYEYILKVTFVCVQNGSLLFDFDVCIYTFFVLFFLLGYRQLFPNVKRNGPSVAG